MKDLLSPVSPSALVDTNFVRAIYRRNAEQVSAMVDSGELPWAWDVSARSKGTIRELRFWSHAVLAPQMTARLTLDEVISRILPSARTFFHSGEVAQLLLVSRGTLGFLAREIHAPRKNRAFLFPRSGFEAWLRTRWLGGAKN